MVDFTKYKIVNILDIANIERAEYGKKYPEGTIKIQLSATKGQIEYMEKAGFVEKHYAILQTIDNTVDKKYLFISIQSQWKKFFYKYKTGINIQIGIFKYLNIPIHNLETQKYIVDAIETQERLYAKENEVVNCYKSMKKAYLQRMFI